MSYYLGIAIKLVPILIGAIFIFKLTLMSQDDQKMDELDKKLTPSVIAKMVIYLPLTLLLVATIAMAVGHYSDDLIKDSELGQKQDKKEQKELKDLRQQLSCSPIGALSSFSKCDK